MIDPGAIGTLIIGLREERRQQEGSGRPVPAVPQGGSPSRGRLGSLTKVLASHLERRRPVGGRDLKGTPSVSGDPC